jgi:membrane protein DedA with SNARE-associated domain
MNSLPPHLQSLQPYVQAVTPYLDKYGYAAVFIGVLLESFGVPLPGETLLIAGSLFAAIGNFHVIWVFLLGLTAAVLGDNIGYAIGYFGGRALVLRYGRYILLTPRRLRLLEGFFERHGGKVVAVARFIEGLRQFNGIVAGIGRMKWSRFLLYNVIGATLWVAFWVCLTYFLGARLASFVGGVKHVQIYILASLVFIATPLMIFLLIRHYVKKDRADNE